MLEKTSITISSNFQLKKSDSQTNELNAPKAFRSENKSDIFFFQYAYKRL